MSRHPSFRCSRPQWWIVLLILYRYTWELVFTYTTPTSSTYCSQIPSQCSCLGNAGNKSRQTTTTTNTSFERDIVQSYTRWHTHKQDTPKEKHLWDQEPSVSSFEVIWLWPSITQVVFPFSRICHVKPPQQEALTQTEFQVGAPVGPMSATGSVWSISTWSGLDLLSALQVDAHVVYVLSCFWGLYSLDTDSFQHRPFLCQGVSTVVTIDGQRLDYLSIEKAIVLNNGLN